MKKPLLILLTASFLSACQGSIEGGAIDYGAAGVPATGRGTGQAGTTAVGGGGTTVIGTGAAGTTSVVTGAAGTTGTGAAGVTGTPGACAAGGIPTDVQVVLSGRCIACHGNPPIAGVPASFTSYAAVTAPSKTDPTKSNMQLALTRLQDNAMPMPPAPLMRATTAELATISAWVSAGTPAASCADGGVANDGGSVIPTVDPFAAAPTCTSKTMWTQGNQGSKLMNPGQACISCHAMGGDGPRYAIAGTLYPTAHEPNNCNGASTATGAQIVIVDAKKQTLTLTPDAAGNFYWSGTLATPYLAKVVYMGRERAMIEGQTSGDCNTCHTQTGAMPTGTMKAPGRIILP
jgi:hypothetical protein